MLHPRLLLLPALLLLATPAHAQAPSSVQPGQVIRQFEPPLAPHIEKDGGVEVAPSAAPLTPASEEGVTFVLQRAVLDNSTIYKQADVDAALSAYTGKTVGFDVLEDMALLLTAQYRAAGYLNSRVLLAEQEIEGGVVHFTAVEGYISDVIVQGDAQAAGDFLTAAIARVKAMRPLHADELEQALLLLNDLPGITVKTALRAAPDEIGASQAVMTVEHSRWDAIISADNRGSRFLGPWQGMVTAGVNNLMGAGSRTVVRGVAAVPVDEMLFFDVQHEKILGASGLKLDLHAAVSETQPGGSVSTLGITGDSALLEGRVSLPIIRTRRKNVTAYAGMQGLNTSSELLGLPDARDRVRTVRMGAALDFSGDDGGVTLLDMHMRQGFDILDATQDGAGRSRVNGRHVFTSFRAAASRFQPLPGKFSALLSAEGQYAARALLASEEFALGGAAFGRGYDAAEITGDHGAAAALELRYTNTLPVTWAERYQLYGFYDIGTVWNRDRVALDPKRESLSSAGGGLRLYFMQGTEASVEAAFPLTRPVTAEGMDNDMRVFLRLTQRLAGK